MTRILLSIILALAIHGLIFCFDGEWLKKRQYHEARPSPVTISLAYPPPANNASDYKPEKNFNKNEANTHENQSGKTERIPGSPVSRSDLTDTLIQTDIPSVSGSKEESVVADSLSFPVDKGNAESYPQKKPEVPEQSYYHTAGEMQPIDKAVKEAIPLYKENPAPVYPLQAKKRGYEGIVVLEVLVTKEGNAGKVSVFKSSRYSLLDEAAVSSVKKWRFEPGRRGDRKVDMPVKIPIRFKLESE